MTKNKLMNYYTSIVRLFNKIHFFGIIFCCLFYFKKEKEINYLQIFVLIISQGLFVILFDLSIIFNYLAFYILNTKKCKDFYNKDNNKLIKNKNRINKIDIERNSESKRLCSELDN